MAAMTQTALDLQCDESVHLRAQLARAIKSLVKAHISHYTARMIGDPEVSHLEVVLDSANAEWKQASRSYSEHRKAHGC
jgi:hypothetical protein